MDMIHYTVCNFGDEDDENRELDPATDCMIDSWGMLNCTDACRVRYNFHQSIIVKENSTIMCAPSHEKHGNNNIISDSVCQRLRKRQTRPSLRRDLVRKTQVAIRQVLDSINSHLYATRKANVASF